MRRGWIVWILAVLPLLPAPTGESLYLGQCAVCHGERGEGGRGPSLARNSLRHAPNDEALFRVIRRGLPDAGMPGTALAESEIRLLMTHVRGLGRVAVAPALPGDARRGEALYWGKAGCAGCHSVFGPDLNGIGTRRSAAHLRTSLTDPNADIPAGFVLLEVVTLDGRKISGARVNEDSFSLQLREISGAIRSFWKSELRTVTRLAGRSPMPTYRGVLLETELDDLTAFLAGWQEGRR